MQIKLDTGEVERERVQPRTLKRNQLHKHVRTTLTRDPALCKKLTTN